MGEIIQRVNLLEQEDKSLKIYIEPTYIHLPGGLPKKQ